MKTIISRLADRNLLIFISPKIKPCQHTGLDV